MISFNEYLLERRSPKSQTESALDILKKYANDPDIYISFTQIDKIGINPGSIWHTPNGIYTYPLKEYFDKNPNETLIRLIFPFASNKDYINILKKNCNTFVNDMSKDYTDADLKKDIKKLRDLYSDIDITKIKSSNIRNLKQSEYAFLNILKQHKLTPNENIKRILDSTKKSLKEVQDKIKAIDKKDIENDFAKTKRIIEHDLELYTDILKQIPKIKKAKTPYAKYKIASELDRLIPITSKKELEADTELQAYIDNFLNSFKTVNYYKKLVSKLEKDLKELTHGIEPIIQDGIKNSNTNMPISKLWNITRILANGGDQKTIATDMNQKWNNILRKLGYCGFADKSGMGVIHPNELIQAVFFSRKAFKLIDRIQNVSYEIQKINNIDDFMKLHIKSQLSVDGDYIVIHSENKNVFGKIKISEFKKPENLIRMLKHFKTYEMETIISTKPHTIKQNAELADQIINNKLSIKNQSIKMWKILSDYANSTDKVYKYEW
jgi:tRNA(Ser,Leu) C12 N-acetylase TAN1